MHGMRKKVAEKISYAMFTRHKEIARAKNEKKT